MNEFPKENFDTDMLMPTWGFKKIDMLEKHLCNQLIALHTFWPPGPGI